MVLTTLKDKAMLVMFTLLVMAVVLMWYSVYRCIGYRDQVKQRDAAITLLNQDVAQYQTTLAAQNQQIAASASAAHATINALNTELGKLRQQVTRQAELDNYEPKETIVKVCTPDQAADYHKAYLLSRDYKRGTLK